MENIFGCDMTIACNFFLGETWVSHENIFGVQHDDQMENYFGCDMGMTWIFFFCCDIFKNLYLCVLYKFLVRHVWKHIFMHPFKTCLNVPLQKTFCPYVNHFKNSVQHNLAYVPTSYVYHMKQKFVVTCHTTKKNCYDCSKTSKSCAPHHGYIFLS
jgi:hypothetical protein